MVNVPRLKFRLALPLNADPRVYVPVPHKYVSALIGVLLVVIVWLPAPVSINVGFMVTPDAAAVTLPATSMALLVVTQVNVPEAGPAKLIAAHTGGTNTVRPLLPVPFCPHNTLQL